MSGIGQIAVKALKYTAAFAAIGAAVAVAWPVGGALISYLGAATGWWGAAAAGSGLTTVAFTAGGGAATAAATTLAGAFEGVGAAIMSNLLAYTAIGAVAGAATGATIGIISDGVSSGIDTSENVLQPPVVSSKLGQMHAKVHQQSFDQGYWTAVVNEQKALAAAQQNQK